MKRKILLALALFLSSLASPSMAISSGRVTLLVVPARYSVMQVAFDMAQKYAMVLVSYQGDASSDAPLLHAWNGKEWIKISMEDYASAAFLQVTPGEAILIGDENLLPPVLASSIVSWCPKVTIIPSIDTATLVNSFAKEFKFKSSQWEWFAKRYNLTLNDENAALRSSSWYDRPAYKDEYSPKIDRWLMPRRVVRAPADLTEPVVESPEGMPSEKVPAESAPQVEPLPAGADAVAEPQANLASPDAAFTASPMPEEEARKALQAVPAQEPAQLAPADAGMDAP